MHLIERSELVTNLDAGSGHAVVRPVAEIGVGRMGDLRDDVPVLIEPITGA